MRLIFAGSDVFACPCLQTLVKSSHTVKAVITQPDRPYGRGRKLRANPLKTLATTLNLPIWEPESLQAPMWVERFKEARIDAIVVVAYGRLIPATWLTTPPWGCINVHASLLPAWRGASPIQSALLHGDRICGVSIMAMEATLDTGPIFAQASLEASADETAGSLRDKLSHLGAKLLQDTLDDPTTHLSHPMIQDHNTATFAPKISKADAQLNWQQTATSIDRMIRAYNPWPIAWSILGDIRVRILSVTVSDCPSTQPPGTLIKCDQQGLWVATHDWDVCITALQWPGKKAMAAHQLSQLKQIRIGDRFKEHN